MDEVTQIRIGKTMFGIIGLKAALAETAIHFRNQPHEQAGKMLRQTLSRSNYIPAANAGMYEQAFAREYLKFIGASVDDAENEVLRIDVLGPGCAQCEQLEQEVMAAISELGVAGDLEHVRNPAAIGRYGVMGTPALVINDQVKSVGQVPPRHTIKAWIEQAVTQMKTKVKE